jgi:hypothetical protein
VLRSVAAVVDSTLPLVPSLRFSFLGSFFAPFNAKRSTRTAERAHALRIACHSPTARDGAWRPNPAQILRDSFGTRENHALAIAVHSRRSNAKM